jgi:putative FmdB family regulatory protein
VPRYKFECEQCNLQYTKVMKIGNPRTSPCPVCKTVSKRVPEGFGVQFQRNPNAPPGNTGVSRHDYPSADMAIGPDAERRWEYLERRGKIKEQVRQQGGTHKLIRTDGQGYVEYGAMTESGAKTRRDIAREAVKVLQKTEPERKSDRELSQ